MPDRISFVDDELSGERVDLTSTDDSSSRPFAARSERFPSQGNVTVRLKDGKPDWEGLRAKSKEKWDELVKDPEFLRRFNLQEAKAGIVEVDPEFVKQALGIMSQVQAAVIGWKFKLPYPLALQIASFNEQEMGTLTPPTQRVIGKYMPGLVAKYGDEFILLSALAMITMTKFRIAAVASAKMKAQQEAQPLAAASGNGEAKQAVTI